jgi:hypothetical protein
MPVPWREKHQYYYFSEKYLARIDEEKAAEHRSKIADLLAQVHDAIAHATDFLGMIEQHRIEYPGNTSEEDYQRSFQNATEHIRNHRRRVAQYERMLAQLDEVFPRH